MPLLVLGALVLLVALAALAARRLGWEPRWGPGARHALEEAGHRAGARWADFEDFLRLRR